MPRPRPPSNVAPKRPPFCRSVFLSGARRRDHWFFSLTRGDRPPQNRGFWRAPLAPRGGDARERASRGHGAGGIRAEAWGVKGTTFPTPRAGARGRATLPPRPPGRAPAAPGPAHPPWFWGTGWWEETRGSPNRRRGTTPTPGFLKRARRFFRPGLPGVWAGPDRRRGLGAKAARGHAPPSPRKRWVPPRLAHALTLGVGMSPGAKTIPSFPKHGGKSH